MLEPAVIAEAFAAGLKIGFAIRSFATAATAKFKHGLRLVGRWPRVEVAQQLAKCDSFLGATLRRMYERPPCGPIGIKFVSGHDAIPIY
ncbi:MAG: hypothetical protein R2911_40665 [Caldilineaceae bacterium]